MQCVASNGYIYALSNPSYRNMLKIGYSANPEARAEDLYTTAVPTPFEIEYQEQVRDPKKVEGLLHAQFADKRVNEDREFFRVSVSAVKWAMWVYWFTGRY